MFASFGDSNNSEDLIQADIYFVFLFITYKSYQLFEIHC